MVAPYLARVNFEDAPNPNLDNALKRGDITEAQLPENGYPSCMQWWTQLKKDLVEVSQKATIFNHHLDQYPSLKTTEAFIARGIEYWKESKPKELPMIVELKNSGEIISASGFNEKSDFDIPMFETGYWIDKKYAGNGYITEAVIAVSRLAFEYFSAVRVQICAQKENIKSIAVAKRAGFIKEATLKNYRLDCVSHKPCDEMIYACFDKQMLPKLNLFKIIKK